MTREEFWNYINCPEIIRQVYIVSIRKRYNEYEKWEYTNQILEPDDIGGFVWRNDWHEGERYVEILGCIAVSDVEVPDFEEEHKFKAFSFDTVSRNRQRISKDAFKDQDGKTIHLKWSSEHPEIIGSATLNELEDGISISISEETYAKLMKMTKEENTNGSSINN